MMVSGMTMVVSAGVPPGAVIPVAVPAAPHYYNRPPHPPPPHPSMGMAPYPSPPGQWSLVEPVQAENPAPLCGYGP